MNPRCWSSQLSVYCRILGALGALLAVSNRVARAQLAPNQPTGTATAAAAPAAPDQSASVVAAGQQEEAAVQMTPFEVQAAKERGYYTQNTLAGTRLNNNIADLPSSITVVDQAGTRGHVLDEHQRRVPVRGQHRRGAHVHPVRAGALEPAGCARPAAAARPETSRARLDTGNRVRGLSAADHEEDNFFSLYRIPFDCIQHPVGRDRPRPELDHLRHGKPGGHRQPIAHPGPPGQAELDRHAHGRQLGNVPRDLRTSIFP